jgi:hypothetical protein
MYQVTNNHTRTGGKTKSATLYYVLLVFICTGTYCSRLREVGIAMSSQQGAHLIWGSPGVMGIWDWEGGVSLQATWDQREQNSTTQEEGFQVSKGELASAVSKGLRLDLVLLICIYVS